MKKRPNNFFTLLPMVIACTNWYTALNLYWHHWTPSIHNVCVIYTKLVPNFFKKIQIQVLYWYLTFVEIYISWPDYYLCKILDTKPTLMEYLLGFAMGKEEISWTCEKAEPKKQKTK